MDETTNVEIIICTEKGNLEIMSRLLVSSIRSLPNSWSKIPIYSYQPRKGMQVSEATVEFFRKNDVQLIDIPLNQNFLHYPLSNKPIVCSYHEKNSSAEYLLFVDSDSLFLQPPELLRDYNFDIQLRPVDLTNNMVATDVDFITGDSFYWKSIYQLLDIKRVKSVQSTIDKRNILEYYNSGLVCVRRERSIFSNWMENFEKIMTHNIMLKNGIFFIEQTALSATIAEMNLNVDTLSTDYNFPVGYFLKKWRGNYPFSLHKKVHIHYHKLLKYPELVSRLVRKLSKLENMSWLQNELQKTLLD